MANEILLKTFTGTPMVFAHGDDFDNTPFADTEEMDMSGLGIGDSRQSPKADLGDLLSDDGKLPQRVAVLGAFEFADAPAITGTVELYWAASPSMGATDDNPYLITGSDAEIATPSAQFLGQLQFIGSIPVQNVADVVFQRTFVTSFALRYGSLLVFNNTDQAFEAVADKIHVDFYAMVDEAQ